MYKYIIVLFLVSCTNYPILKPDYCKTDDLSVALLDCINNNAIWKQSKCSINAMPKYQNDTKVMLDYIIAIDGVELTLKCNY